MPAAAAPTLLLSGTPCVQLADGSRLALPPTDALLLAWLALEGPTPRERIAGLLWPASDAGAARNALRQRLFRLRRQLGAGVIDDADSAGMLALAAGVQHDLDTQSGVLGTLHAPDAPELDAWLARRREAQRLRAQQAAWERIDALERAGEPAAALPLALALRDAEPLAEAAHRRVMRLHYLCGDRAAALLAFDRCEQVLKHEIGAAPSPETLALLATIEGSGAVSGSGTGGPPRGAVPAAVLRPPRLVGRDAELAALQRALVAGQLVLVIGEAGMGKSRLLQALAVARPGVLHSSGRPGDALVPYATLARALRQVLDHDPTVADPALRRALAPLLPELFDPPAPAPAGQDGLPAAARWRPADGGVAPPLPRMAASSRAQPPPLAPPVLALLQRAARTLHTLALDDLHFADDATLDLLQTLLAAPRDQPGGTAAGTANGAADVGRGFASDGTNVDASGGTSGAAMAGSDPRDSGSGAAATLRWCLGLRPPALGSRLQGLLTALASAGPHLRLALQPLTVAQMAELVDSLALPGVAGQAHGVAGSAQIAAVLHQRTGGNPLFALETLKLAWADGSLFAHTETSDAGDASPAGAAGLLPRPDTLAQLIGQQLARLSPPALQLARVAAVAGVDFCIPLAEALLQRNALELADAWAELETQQVLRGASFAHDLVHDAVLQGLPEIIARHLHGHTAAWLERDGSGNDGTGGDNGPGGARQGCAASEPARIAAHWEAAGQRARALPALRAAAERAHRAYREGERIDFLLRASDIAEAADRLDDAFELVHSAVEAHMNTIRQADGLPLLDRLQALTRTPLQQARVAVSRAWYSTVLGDADAAVELGEQALVLALALEESNLIATMRQRLGTTLGMLGRFDDALPHMRAAEPWMAVHAAPEDRCEFSGNLAVLLDNIGQPAEAQVHHLQALALSQAQSDQAQLATLLANYALSRIDAGDIQRGSEQAELAQRIVSTYAMTGSSTGFIATLQAQCARAQGRYGHSLQWCERAEAILAECNPVRVPVARLHQAHVWLDIGQHARALQLLGGARLAAARAMPPRYAVRWMVLLARLQRRLGGAAAQQVAPLLADAAALAPDTGWPELRLIVRTEQALALAAAEALDALDTIAADARQRRLHSAELGALLHACHLAARHALPRAAALARAALAAAGNAEALHAERGLRWLAPAQALAAAGSRSHRDEAAALAEAGCAWLRSTAAAHLAPEFVDSFLHQQPVNRELLAWRPGAASAA